MTRMISVMDDTYERLKKMKGKKSFTAVLNDLMEEKNQKILKFAGAFKEEWKNIDSKKFVESIRKGQMKADKKRFKELEKHWKE